MVMLPIPFFYINIIYIPSQRCCANDFCIEKLLLASISAMVEMGDNWLISTVSDCYMTISWLCESINVLSIVSTGPTWISHCQQTPDMKVHCYVRQIVLAGRFTCRKKPHLAVRVCTWPNKKTRLVCFQ